MTLGVQQSAAKFADMKQDSNPRFGEYENLTVSFDTQCKYWPDKFAIYQWGKDDEAMHIDQREAEWLIDALQKAIAVRATPTPHKEDCEHDSVNMGTHPDEGFMIICKDCGADLSPAAPLKEGE